MPAAYESVTFLPAEAQFVEVTMTSYSQNQAVGNRTDNSVAVPITRLEVGIALEILRKVQGQMRNQFKTPISFTPEEAHLMQYLYNNYIQGHGKPQGDIDWVYYIRFDDNSAQLIINVMRKIGCILPNLPVSTYPQSYNPFPRL